MDKGKVGKYSKLTLVYFIGVAVIVYGLYMFLNNSGGESTSNSFYMMFSGLVVATAGSIYGHNKVAGPGSKTVQGDIKGKIEESKEAASKEVKEISKQIEEIKGMEQKGQATKAAAAGGKLSKRLAELKKREQEEQKRLAKLREEEEKEIKRLEEERKKEEERMLKEQQKRSKEEAQKKAEPPAPQAGGVVKVIICPSCGEENKYSAKFCDNCGKKIRP